MVKLRIFDHQGSQAPRRVLLTRLSAIGDCVLTIPLAVRVKQLWPNCQLTWVVDCSAAELLEPHGAVDEVLKIEKRWMSHPERWGALRAELQQRQFDLVLDPQGLSKSGLLGRFSKAKLRVGFDYSHGRELAPLLATHRVRRTARHMVDTYLQLLSPWCATPVGAGEFQMPVYSSAVPSVERLLEGLQLNHRAEKLVGCHHPGAYPGWVALNVGAGWDSKQWPPERFGWIAGQLWQRYGLRSLVLWAGESEQALAEQVVVHGQGAAVAAPPTTLSEMVEVIRRSEMLISGDTAALQLASAVKTPCVGLFGPTWADESGSYGNKHLAIQSSVLPDPGRGMRRSSSNSMNAIEISEVLRACTQLLGQLGISHGHADAPNAHLRLTNLAA